MRTAKPDVIVAGAGPGGALAAYELASRGAKILWLDKRSFPRDKACGDAISLDAVEILRDVGLAPRLRSWFGWHECLLTSPGGQGASCRGSAQPGADHGVIARRLELDAALVDRARARGAELIERSTVTSVLVEDGECAGVRIEREGRAMEVRAPLVIAADGFHSSVARSLGLAHRRSITAFAVRGYFEIPPGAARRGHAPQIELHLDRSLLPGYGWYFPVTETIANVGVGILVGAMERRGVTLDALFEQFVATNAFIRDRLAGARRIGRLRGAPLPMGPGPSHTVHGRCLFVGDAAGFVDALTGEGIGAAMHSGRMAAETAIEALGSESFDARSLSNYDRRCRTRFGASMRAAWLIQRMLGSGLFVERLVRGAARRPALGAALFDMVAGAAPKTAALHPANIARALL